MLAGNVSSMPEVGGKNSAFYVDPLSEEDIASGLRAVLLNPERAKELVARGYANAARFDWDQSAEQLQTIVETLIQQG